MKQNQTNRGDAATDLSLDWRLEKGWSGSAGLYRSRQSPGCLNLLGKEGNTTLFYWHWVTGLNYELVSVLSSGLQSRAGAESELRKFISDQNLQQYDYYWVIRVGRVTLKMHSVAITDYVFKNIVSNLIQVLQCTVIIIMILMIMIGLCNVR